MSFLKQLEEDLREQNAEEKRIFTKVEDIRTYYRTDNPTLDNGFSIDMCVYSLVEKELLWEINFIDKDCKPDFNEIKMKLDQLDDIHKKKYFFRMTIFKGRNGDKNITDYKVGEVVFAKKLFDLQEYFGSMQGRKVLTFASKVIRPATPVPNTKVSRQKK